MKLVKCMQSDLFITKGKIYTVIDDWGAEWELFDDDKSLEFYCKSLFKESWYLKVINKLIRPN